MQVVVSFAVETSGLMGFPYEFHPRLAIWTTNPVQPMSVDAGKAVDIVTLDEPPPASAGANVPAKFSFSNKSVTFTAVAPGDPKAPLVPISDPMSELCISMFVSSRFSGGGDQKHPPTKEEEPRDYTIDLGQVNIPWHVILRFLVSDGHALLTRAERGDKDALATLAASHNGKRLFPKTTVKQELSTMALMDGVRYRVQLLRAEHKKKLSIEFDAIDGDDLSHKATISVIVGLMSSTDVAPEKCLALLEQHLIQNQPYGERSKKHGLDKFLAALQHYDEKTSKRTEIFIDAMKNYQKHYEAPWVQSNNSRLLVLPAGGADDDDDNKVVFRPDVPSMGRFHLPTWVLGNERYPFAMWWYGTLPGMARHLPEPTSKTERWLVHLLMLAMRRAHIEPAAFLRTASFITSYAHEAPRDFLRSAALKGTDEYNTIIRVLETTSYLSSMVAHNCRYSNDVQRGNRKYVLKKGKHNKAKFTFDVETPQHNTAAGIADDGDCEDMEYLIAILQSLLRYGRVSGDVDTGGRGWSHNMLLGVYHMTQLLVMYHHFGAVCGAQLKDGEGHENDEGIVGSKDDMSRDIGGHMYALVESIVRLADRYQKHRTLVMRATKGIDLAAILNTYISGKLMPFVKNNEELFAALRAIYAVLPPFVNEGTGRQEPFLLPGERYFGISIELIQRTANHASELEVLQRWPKAFHTSALPKKADAQEKAPTKKSSPPAVDSDNDDDDDNDDDEDDDEESDNPMTEILRTMKHDSEQFTSAPAAAHQGDASSLPAPLALGEALAYSFQRRLLSESRFIIDVKTHMRFERHVSPFYRRLAHTASDLLKSIAPHVFDHMIWVCPQRMTYGPTIREFLDDSGNEALPLPLGNLSASYMRNEEEEDIMSHFMRRIIPYDLSFSHMSDAQMDTMLSVSSSAHRVDHDCETFTAIAPRSSSSSTSLDEHDDVDHESMPFFAKTVVRYVDPMVDQWTHSDSNVSSAGNHHRLLNSEEINSLSTNNVQSSCHTVYVGSDGPIAEVIRAIGSRSGNPTAARWEGTSTGRINVAYRNDEQAELLKQHIVSSVGITRVEIVRERILPTMSDTLAAYFDRRIAFEINDVKCKHPLTEKILHANAPLSSSGISRWNHLLHSDSRKDEAPPVASERSSKKRLPMIKPVKIVRIHDGDTVVDTHDVHYRLVGIDTPELAQPGGYEAREALEKLIHGAKFIGVLAGAKDKYNRTLGTLYSASNASLTKDLVNLNDAMVEQGWAWSYARTSPSSGTDLLAMERDARADKRGIWAMKGVTHMLPHDYRKAKREGTLPPSFHAVTNNRKPELHKFD